MWRCLYLICLKTAIVLITVLVSPVKLTSPAYENVVITDVTSVIDISTQLVNIDYKVRFISKDHFLRSFVFIVHPSLVDNLSYIFATGRNVDNNIPLINHGNGYWEILFENPIQENQEEYLTVNTIYSHVLKPYPSKIKQNEKHLVLYAGSISFFSPYLSLNQTSYVTFGKGSLEGVMKPDDFELKKTFPLTYISKMAIQPYTSSFTQIHFEHTVPFLRVRELYRTIEVSHWGSIMVKEEILVDNSGAKLYGPYHRQLYNDKGKNKITSFTTALPASATDVTVYDDIGLISSVTTTSKEDCVEMELHPRFLLYGGWKIKYYISYNVPSYEYLFKNDDDADTNYILKMRTIDHIFNDMVIDKAVVKIILPEGTEDFSLKTPYLVTRHNETYQLSYLDTIGKPVITFSKTNLVEQHIQDFVLSYQFSKFKMFFEPFYITMFVELIFIIVILFIRIDFSISKEEEEEQCEQKNSCENVSLVKVSNKTKKKRH